MSTVQLPLSYCTYAFANWVSSVRIFLALLDRCNSAAESGSIRRSDLLRCPPRNYPLFCAQRANCVDCSCPLSRNSGRQERRKCQCNEPINANSNKNRCRHTKLLKRELRLA